jgi:triacylglycerol lipase
MENFSFVVNTTKYQSRNALALGTAAKLAYEEEEKIRQEVTSWGFNKFKFFDRAGTQAFVIGKGDIVIVSFRGTEPEKLQDWITDAKFDLVDGPFGKVHDGFSRALGRLWRDLTRTIDEFKDNAQSLWFTGHSLGAALATLAVATLREEDKPIHGLYTFGQPRIGDRTFERTFNADFKPRCFRFVNNNDVVTRVPLRAMNYSHVGTFLYFDKDGNLSDDLSWWYQFLDRVEGRIEDLGKPGTDGIKDHSMIRYLVNLEKNIEVDPFKS